VASGPEEHLVPLKNFFPQWAVLCHSLPAGLLSAGEQAGV